MLFRLNLTSLATWCLGGYTSKPKFKFETNPELHTGECWPHTFELLQRWTCLYLRTFQGKLWGWALRALRSGQLLNHHPTRQYGQTDKTLENWDSRHVKSSKLGCKLETVALFQVTWQTKFGMLSAIQPTITVPALKALMETTIVCICIPLYANVTYVDNKTNC